MLIIFDLDDTLIDTTNKFTPVVFEKTLESLKRQGLKLKDEKSALNKLIEINKKAKSSKDAIEKFLSDLDAKDFFNSAIKSLEKFPSGDIKIFTLKNANKILRFLSKNHKLAIVTIGNKKFQFEKIKKAGIDTAVFCKIIIMNSNEDKGIYYKKIIDELGILSSDTLVCGDKINIDLKPAKQMGCTTVHMKYGRGINFLKDENVDYVIYQLDEIKNVLDKFKGKNYANN